MKIKTTLKFNFISVRIAIIKKLKTTNGSMDARKKTLYISNRNVNKSHTAEISINDPQNLKIEPLYDLVISLLGIYLK
jgi:hypothetical protein